MGDDIGVPGGAAGVQAEVGGSGNETDLARFGPLVAATVIFIPFACHSNQDLSKLFSWEYGTQSLVRLTLLVALTLTTWLGLVQTWRKSIAYKTSWWNIGGKLDDPSWTDVLKMTKGEEKDDPIVPIIHKPQDLNWTAVVSATATYLVLVGIWIEGAILIASSPTIPPFCAADDGCGSSAHWGLNSNLTALLALIAAAISIYFTYRQFQAKVKAESRQAWIDKLRDNIAGFIALAPTVAGDRTSLRRSKNFAKFTHRRLEMELMLNPSEKDHRLLMFLSLKLAFYLKCKTQFEAIHDVQNLRAAVLKDVPDSEQVWEEILGEIPDGPSPEYVQKFHDLVGYTLRLAHVVLKREWERVKATR